MNETPNTQQAADELKGSVLEVVRALLATQRNDDVIAVVAKLVERNKDLELLLAKMRQGKNRSERTSSAQLELALELLRKQPEGELKDADAKLDQAAETNGGRDERPKPPKQPALRRPAPPELRRVLNPIPVSEEQRPCPVCGTERECIGHEETEVIDLVPAEVIVRIDKREVVACPKCDAELERAPLGDKVVVGGAYGSRLVAELVVGKYWDGLPLNRQGEQLARLGLQMPSSSMSDQIMWATDLLRPLWIAQMAQVLGAVIVHVDGTSLPVKDKDSAKGIVSGALWGYVGDTDKALYLYTSTGKKRGQVEGEIGPEEFLSLREGYIVADASNLFDVTFQSPTRIEVGCNMHSRRYFVKALDAGDARAAVPLKAYKSLYDVEDAARGLTDEQRWQLRQKRSKPIYDELLSWCDTYRLDELPTSLLGKALQYTHNHRIALTRFLDDGRVPIDNGIVERLHRRPAVGRRNFLFAGSHAAGERAAVAYTILGSCVMVGVNPAEYLADILPKLTRGVFRREDYVAMLPTFWKVSHHS